MEAKLILSDPDRNDGQTCHRGHTYGENGRRETEEQRSRVKAFGLRSHSQQRR